MMCNQAKSMGVSVWVIAFSSSVTLSPEMTACASNPQQAIAAADTATLIARFTQIGQSIGALRLTQ